MSINRAYKSLSICLLMVLVVCDSVSAQEEMLIRVSPFINEVSAFGIDYSKSWSDDHQSNFSADFYRHESSNGRVARLATVALSTTLATQNGHSLKFGSSYLPRATFNCLKVGQEFLGNCNFPTLEIRENGSSLNPLSISVTGFRVDWTGPTYRGGFGELSVGMGFRIGGLVYDSPFLKVTNPILLSSSTDGRTLKDLRSDFLQKYPTNDQFSYAVAAAHWLTHQSILSHAVLTELSSSFLILPSSRGEWSPRRFRMMGESKIRLGSGRHELSISLGTQKKREVDALTVNPWTTDGSLTLLTGLSWQYRF